MKNFSIIIFFLIGFQGLFAQNAEAPVEAKMPRMMLDVNYSNTYLFLNSNAKASYSDGDILIKLKNDLELSVMGLLTKKEKYRHNKLYGGIGFSFSEYKINRDLHTEPSGSGHFPVYYYYTPDKLEYPLSLFRFNVQLDHFGVYKRILVFQKFGLAYTVFNRSSTGATHYREQYGSSTPYRDPAHVTPDNPDGWYFSQDYTTTDKNDLDIFKNGISVFYKLGIGYRIKQFTPTFGFEFSYLSAKIASPYLKFQVGVNYAFLKK